MNGHPRTYATFAVALGLAVASGVAAEKNVLVSVHSRTDRTYQRTKLADGSIKPEYYAISNGGTVAGTTRDAAQDQMDVAVIVRAVAENLAEQNYFLAPDVTSATLLLVVQWGRTIPFNGVNYSGSVGDLGSALGQVQNASQTAGPRTAGSPEQAAAIQADSATRLEAEARALQELDDQIWRMQVQNDERDRSNEANAQLLGYTEEIYRANDISRFAGGGGNRYDELRGDIEEPRYYVIISAYDFQPQVDQKKRKLRWVTRISIRVQGSRFEDQVAAMVERGSRYFGRDSGRLIRGYEGTVELGDPTVLGTFEDPEPPAAEAAPAPKPERGK